MKPSTIEAVVFDLGGVLIDWNPRHLYRELMGGDEVAVERFLSTICTQAWNEEQDAGRPFRVAVEELSRIHPDHRDLIEAYDREWARMLKGPIAPSVEILAALRARAVPIYALSNWSAEKFPVARARFDFLAWFEGIVISGEIGMKKPDPRIFEHAATRFRLTPARTLFIDDSRPNVESAARFGFSALHFESPSQLGRDLAELGLLG
jgi:2-haloacid dehalogenase